MNNFLWQLTLYPKVRKLCKEKTTKTDKKSTSRKLRCFKGLKDYASKIIVSSDAFSLVVSLTSAKEATSPERF